MTNSSTYFSKYSPPETKELQFDEKCIHARTAGPFVRKKEKNCDENLQSQEGADARCGDNWDHVGLDAEHKLVLQVVNGKRTEDNTKTLVRNTAIRLNFKAPRLITSDEWRPYVTAILEAFGERHVPPPTGLPGRPRRAFYVPTEDLALYKKYSATVHKTRKKDV